ncbi:MAG: hypothetical protein IPH54_19640 [Rhodoferax sp.]|nr:hypothetical protein [Rhodoferax sp.]
MLAPLRPLAVAFLAAFSSAAAFSTAVDRRAAFGAFLSFTASVFLAAASGALAAEGAGVFLLLVTMLILGINRFKKVHREMILLMRRIGELIFASTCSPNWIGCKTCVHVFVFAKLEDHQFPSAPLSAWLLAMYKVVTLV